MIKRNKHLDKVEELIKLVESFNDDLNKPMSVFVAELSAKIRLEKLINILFNNLQDLYNDVQNVDISSKDFYRVYKDLKEDVYNIHCQLNWIMVLKDNEKNNKHNDNNRT